MNSFFSNKKLHIKSSLFLAVGLSLIGCNDADDKETQDYGNAKIEWNNTVGDMDISISDSESSYYHYSNNDQKYNISSLKYYITNIILEGNNNNYEDAVQVNINKADGVYLIDESNENSQNILLNNIPTGTYNKISFTVGVPEEIVQSGASGGVLDPSSGEALFWNWNAGYIGFSIEGKTQETYSAEHDHSGDHHSTHNSTTEDHSGHNHSTIATHDAKTTISAKGAVTSDNKFSFHIGGWRNIEPLEGETTKFVNNVKNISINLDQDLIISKDAQENIYISTDIQTLFSQAQVDFSKQNVIHSPVDGASFANVMDQIFTVKNAE